jgi:hypothetical protein
MIRAGSGRRASLLHRGHIRVRSAVAPRGTASAAPTRSAGADDLVLTQLLSIARLTPAQAVALGADLLAGLEDAEGRTQLRPEAVRVGRDGRARLVDARHPPSTNGVGLASAAALLDGLTAATRSSAADHGLPSALERAAAETRSPHGRLAIAAAILREADAAGGAQARAELARLVAMVAGGQAPALEAAPAPRAPVPRRRRPRRPPRAVARAAVARSWKWVLSLVVLVAAILIEIAYLSDEIGRDVQAVLEAGRSAPTAISTPPSLPPVAPPAPIAAGTISRVDLRPVVPCTPDAACALRLHMLVQPRAEPQTITWDFRIHDRCTGAAVSVPGGNVTVPPHGDRADVVSTVGLPQADALAVLAVTSQPFTAASTAVHVPAPGACGI